MSKIVEKMALRCKWYHVCGFMYPAWCMVYIVPGDHDIKNGGHIKSAQITWMNVKLDKGISGITECFHGQQGTINFAGEYRLTLWILKLLTKFTPRGITADNYAPTACSAAR